MKALKENCGTHILSELRLHSDVSVHVQTYKQVQMSADKIKAEVLISARFSRIGYTGNVSISCLESWFLIQKRNTNSLPKPEMI